jgi:transposase-like protein
MNCPNCNVPMELFVKFKGKNDGTMRKYFCEVCHSIYVVDEDDVVVGFE